MQSVVHHLYSIYILMKKNTNNCTEAPWKQLRSTGGQLCSSEGAACIVKGAGALTHDMWNLISATSQLEVHKHEPGAILPLLFHEQNEGMEDLFVCSVLTRWEHTVSII